MQHGFKTKNLGKDIRPTLAVISNPEVRKSMKKSYAKISQPKNSNDTDDILSNKDIDTLLEFT